MGGASPTVAPEKDLSFPKIGAAFPLARHILWLGDTHSNQAIELQGRPPQRAHLRAQKRICSRLSAQAIPQIFLHSTYTGQNGLFFALNFRWFDKSKDLERVKGTSRRTQIVD